MQGSLELLGSPLPQTVAPVVPMPHSVVSITVGEAIVEAELQE